MAEDYPDTPPQYNPEPTPAYAEQTKALQGYSSISLGGLRNPPVRKIVEQQIAELEAQVAERKKLLAALDAEPGTEKILDSLRKIGI